MSSPSVSSPTVTRCDLSIVIVSYNTCEMLRDCLLVLPNATQTLDTEIFVVDNASPDKSADMVRDEFPTVHLITNSQNVGFVRANNQALLLATGRHVLLLNPDTEARPGSLTKLVDYLDANPAVGAIGPKLLNTDGSLQKNGRFFPTPLGEFIGHLGLAKYGSGRSQHNFEHRFEYGRDDFDQIVEVDQVSGACIMVPHRIMAQIGALSEDFFMYYEETEWCWRIKRAGYKVIYFPEAEVVHHWMGSVRQASYAMTSRLLNSTQIYYRKTAGRKEQIAIWFVRQLAYVRNRWIGFGVAMKAKLRKGGMVK